MGGSKKLSYGFCDIMEQSENNLGLIFFISLKLGMKVLTYFVLMLPSISSFLEDTGKH